MLVLASSIPAAEEGPPEAFPFWVYLLVILTAIVAARVVDRIVGGQTAHTFTALLNGELPLRKVNEPTLGGYEDTALLDADPKGSAAALLRKQPMENPNKEDAVNDDPESLALARIMPWGSANWQQLEPTRELHRGPHDECGC